MSNQPYQPASKWILFFTGFRQTQKFYAGIRRLEDTVYGKCACPSTRIELHGWQVDVDYLANRITDTPIGKELPTIQLVGYSWGGATAIALAEELQSRGFKVEFLALCDAIARGPIPYLSIRSLMGPYISLTIPSNVSKVIVWRQTTKGITNIQGSRVYFQDINATLLIDKCILVTVPHESMDEQPRFQKRVLEQVCPIT